MPLLLLAAATEAVSLVKKGCQLYKDIKGAAGNVKEIYDDINKQFAGKTVSKAQAAQIAEEKKRVQEIANTAPGDAIFQIGEHLGKFFDAFDAIEAMFWQEERAAKKVYVGDVSASRRALTRVLIRTRLQQMYAEMRTEMTWNVPAELDDLWTRFEQMRKQIDREQEIARAEQQREETAARWRQERMIRDLKDKALYAVAVLLVLGEIWLVLGTIAMTRIS